MINEIIIAVLVVILFLSIRYIIKSKAGGKHCIGCPYSDGCHKNCTSEKKEHQ